jgi:hypothetical protein
MGWSFGWQSRSELIEHLTRDQESADARWRTLAKYLSGNTLWAVQEHAPKAAEAQRFIGCYLLRRNGDWGYKDLCESMGPCEVSCPPKFLGMAPVENAGWRERVLAHWQQRRDGSRLVKALARGQPFRSRRSGDTFEFVYAQRGGYVVGRLLEVVPVPNGCRRVRVDIVGTCYRVRKQDVEPITAHDLVSGKVAV